MSARYNTVINPAYYERAIEEIQKHISNPVFFVCSNDIDEAKKILGSNEKFIYVGEFEGMTDLDEFSIMSRCQNHIISNSTFSWWAAWLHGKGINISPNMFFGNRDIIPDGWIKV